MKVIFLDIDGVMLPWPKVGDRSPKLLEQEITFKSLKKIVELTDAKIVLSSTWRGLWYTEDSGCLTSCCKEIQQEWYDLKGMFNKFDLELYDKTAQAVDAGSERGYEIQEWLNRHKDISDFVILDDQSDMVHLKPHLVQINEEIGLRDADIESVIKILEGVGKSEE